NRPLPEADILFFEEPITNDSLWTIIEVPYIASGGERFLCFGVFKNRKHIQRLVPWNNKPGKKYHSSYLIDSVELIKDRND
ncbi:hypothetical protein JYT74_02980, partial [Crocinitomix catalasitica]|nr:hypothetical protein [Crocinitomix catalasitica]